MVIAVIAFAVGAFVGAFTILCWMGSLVNFH